MDLFTYPYPGISPYDLFRNNPNDGMSLGGRNFLIFVADGLRPSSVNPEDTPTLYSIQQHGVNFTNSHALFPTFTTPNASAIATGHYLGDTGDFSNTIYAGYPVNGNPTPFIENDPILGNLNQHYPGNFDSSDPDSFSFYNFLNEETLLQSARLTGYNTATVGKLGPTLIQDVSQGTPDPSTGQVPVPQTIIIDDSTGKTGGIPLSDDIQKRLIRAGLPITTPDRSNGAPSTSQLSNGFSGNNTAPGTLEANYVQQQYFTDAINKVILPKFAQDNNPFAMVYWSRDPDGTQHNQGDSLNSLTPGINGSTSKLAVQNADRNLAQIIAELESEKLPDGSSVYDHTDIVVTADHGFSTISKSVVDAQGTTVNDYASSLTFPGVNPGFLPAGFVAIDLAHGLGLNLFDPDQSTKAADGTFSYQKLDPTQGQRPTFGNGLLACSDTLSTPNATTAPPAKVIVAANGGSDLVYVPDHNLDTLKQVVNFLSQQNYVSGLFVDDSFGSIAGTLPLSCINLKGDAQTPTPALVINFKTFSTDPEHPDQSEVEIADTTLQQGQGMHGSFGRGDTFNNMEAIGPDFKQSFVDNAPVSNVDIAPTLAKILGLNIPTNNGSLTGRVLDEALTNGPDKVAFSQGTIRSNNALNGQRTYLNYQQVGDTKYFDAAGFANGSVGLNTGEKHVLLLSIDGLREADLSDPKLQADIPNILALAGSGVNYTKASTSEPSDSFPGLLSYLTGASPKTTGVYYDDSYDRSLIAPGGKAGDPLGTEVQLAENIDKNPDLLSGGGDFGVGSIDTSRLPLDANGNPVYPHTYVKTNNIFDVAKAAGLHTAYSDKHPGAYDIVNGYNGNGVDDYYSPEINAKVAIDPVTGQLVDASDNLNNLPLATTTTSPILTAAYDDLKVQAILNEINGLNSRATKPEEVPNLFGMNFQALSVAQKVLTGGIAADGTPSAALDTALKHTDQSIGEIVDALKKNGLYDSTLIVLTAKHGQNPRLGSATLVKDNVLTNVLEAFGISVAQATQDDISLIWLKDPKQASEAAVVLNLLKQYKDPGIDTVFYGDSLNEAGFGTPGDSRTPDLIVKLKPGVVLVGNPAKPTKQAEHGGLSPDDLNVGLILGGGLVPSLFRGSTDTDTVDTKQIAVTALQALGLDPKQLQGAVTEGTKPLPFPGTAQAPDRTVAGPDTATTPQGWFLTPAGRQVQLVDPNSGVYGDRPYGVAISPDGQTLIISNDGQSTQSLMVVDRASGNILQTIPYKAPEALYIGVTFSPDGKKVYASAGGNNKIRVYDVNGQTLTETDPILLPQPPTPSGGTVNLYAGGLTLSADGKTLYVADNLGDSMSIIDVSTRKVEDTVAVGHNPYTVLLPKDGKTAYVSNWGEKTVSVVDVDADPKLQQTIEVGTHPNAMVLNPVTNELYVTNADSDNVSVIDTTTNQVIRTIDLSPYPGAKEGSSPNALTVSPDGKTLYVANATNNDLAVIELGAADGTTDQVRGLIPTAWYPAGVVITPDGKQLAVINAKGLGAGPNLKGPNPYFSPDSPPNQYVGSMIEGSLSLIDVPDTETLKQYTQQVVKNNGFDEGSKIRVTGVPQGNVIPIRPGDSSPIKHVIYVIKENRTYDQVLGNLGQGNGDPALTLFGDESAPNQRALAKQYVTLDNFYTDAEVSADGWNWSTGALANTYVQKNWPANYANDPGRNRPYDFEGGNFATSSGSDPQDAFIWNKLSDAGIDYRNYGFRVFGGKVAADANGSTTEPRLAANTDLNYPGYDLTIADSSPELFNSPKTRIDEWLKEFNQNVADKNLPTVEFVRLPNDHTSGTKVGRPTPRAYMADNDYALGKLVDTVSHSPYWNDTAIFVVEDDAQNGPDHVDAHRTITQVISPYTQTGKVDSTFYSTVSMLRTMELIVGIGPMSQYDAAATPMLNSFTDKPDFQPYTAIKPTQSLTEKNPVDAPLASEAEQVNWTAADQNEPLENQMIWKSVKGANSEMPTPITSFRQSDIKTVD